MTHVNPMESTFGTVTKIMLTCKHANHHGRDSRVKKLGQRSGRVGISDTREPHDDSRELYVCMQRGVFRFEGMAQRTPGEG